MPEATPTPYNYKYACICGLTTPVITNYGTALNLSPVPGKTRYKNLLRKDLVPRMALVRTLCTPLQKYRLKMLFFWVLLFTVQKFSENLTVVHNQAFRVSSENNKNDLIQKDAIR